MNKPVAWMDENENVVFEKCKFYPIPLYTHPVKELTLTDEDILEEWTWKYFDSHEDFLLKFAKAILRKAQEK